MSGSNILALISVWALPVLVTVTLHEAAHGFAARLFGDNTAYLLGRISLNPLKHVHPFGTVLLPGMQPRSISRSGVRPMLQVAWADVAFIVLCFAVLNMSVSKPLHWLKIRRRPY